MKGGAFRPSLLLLFIALFLVFLLYLSCNVERMWLSMPLNGANTMKEKHLSPTATLPSRTRAPPSPSLPSPPPPPPPRIIAAATTATTKAATKPPTTEARKMSFKAQSHIQGKQGSIIKKPLSELNLDIVDKATAQHLAQFRDVCTKNSADGFPKNANSRHHGSASKESSAQLCPCIPSTVHGRRIPDARQLLNTTWSQITRELANTDTLIGGYFKPTGCVARRRVAIIVPCRDREKFLRAFLLHMHPLLQRQLIEYRIFVVEQAWPNIFNKAAMMNAGFLESQKLFPSDCVMFHDVDYLMEDERAILHCVQGEALHYGWAYDKSHYKLLYSTFFGGAILMTSRDFRKVNGFSNEFFGWGNEDDDFIVRVTSQNLLVKRPPLASYTTLPHSRDDGNANGWLNGQLINGHRNKAMVDGLSSLAYTLVGDVPQTRPLYTWLHVRLDVSNLPYNMPDVSAVYNQTAGECYPGRNSLRLELSLVTCQFRCDINASCRGFVYYDDIDDHCHLLDEPCASIRPWKGATTFRKEIHRAPTVKDGGKLIQGYTRYDGLVEGKVSGLYDQNLDMCAKKCTEDQRCQAFTFGVIPRPFCFIKFDIIKEPFKPAKDLYDTRTYVKIK